MYQYLSFAICDHHHSKTKKKYKQKQAGIIVKYAFYAFALFWLVNGLPTVW